MLLAILIGLALAFLVHQFYWRRRRLPPGPLPLPVLGNMLPIIRDGAPYRSLQKWKEHYGPVYTYWLGGMPIVCVSDSATIKAVFVGDGDNYLDRAPFGDMSELVRGGNYGVLETSGELWREHRRFTLHTLRDFGLGKAAMQHKIQDEIEYTIKELDAAAASGSVDIAKIMDRTVGSVINLAIFGYRFGESNIGEFAEIRDFFDEHTRSLSSPVAILLLMFIWLRHLPYFDKKWFEMTSRLDRLNGFFRKQIERHREEIDFDSQESSDYCEAFLKEMKKRADEPDSTFTEPQLLNMCFDLWFAGMETTSSTLTWAVIYLICHPEVQERAHEEIARSVGVDRLVGMEDRQQLPYASAIVAETQRCSNIVSQTPLRKAAVDTVINGVTVYAGTTICAQVSVPLYDPEVFPAPETFDPSRFLDASGAVRKIDEFMPFSVGKRACLGEGLARMELFLVIANLLQRYEILPEIAGQPPSMERTMTSGLKPQRFLCRLRERQQ